MTKPELLHRQGAITGIKKGKAVRRRRLSPISLKCAMTVVPVRFFSEAATLSHQFITDRIFRSTFQTTKKSFFIVHVPSSLANNVFATN